MRRDTHGMRPDACRRPCPFSLNPLFFLSSSWSTTCSPSRRCLQADADATWFSAARSQVALASTARRQRHNIQGKMGSSTACEKGLNKKKGEKRRERESRTSKEEVVRTNKGKSPRSRALRRENCRECREQNGSARRKGKRS